MTGDWTGPPLDDLETFNTRRVTDCGGLSILKPSAPQRNVARAAAAATSKYTLSSFIYENSLRKNPHQRIPPSNVEIFAEVQLSDFCRHSHPTHALSPARVSINSQHKVAGFHRVHDFAMSARNDNDKDVCVM